LAIFARIASIWRYFGCLRFIFEQVGVVMTVEQFENWSLYICVGGLIGFMIFIVWDLAKKSKAGKFGTFILFLALGLGLLGFIIKTVLVSTLEK